MDRRNFLTVAGAGVAAAVVGVEAQAAPAMKWRSGQFAEMGPVYFSMEEEGCPEVITPPANARVYALRLRSESGDWATVQWMMGDNDFVTVNGERKPIFVGGYGFAVHWDDCGRWVSPNPDFDFSATSAPWMLGGNQPHDVITCDWVQVMEPAGDGTVQSASFRQSRLSELRLR